MDKRLAGLYTHWFSSIPSRLRQMYSSAAFLNSVTEDGATALSS